MNMILRKMTEEEFASFVEYSVKANAEELMLENDLSPEEALRKAQNEITEMLPGGLETKSHELLTIENALSHENVGFLWSIFEETEGRKQSFLCDFLIFEHQRRKGYASAALRAFEKRAKAEGCVECVLYVAAKNKAAGALYQKCGYQPLRQMGGGQYMIKRL